MRHKVDRKGTDFLNLFSLSSTNSRVYTDTYIHAHTHTHP